MRKYRLIASIVIGVFLLSGLNACGESSSDNREDGGNSAGNATPVVMTEGDPPFPLIATVGMTPSQNRLVVAIQQGASRYPNVQGVYAELRDPARDSPPVIWAGELQAYQDYDGAYWLGYPEIPYAGEWRFDLTVTYGDAAAPVEYTRLWTIYEDDQGPGLLPGERAPLSESFVWSDVAEGDISRITSDPSPLPEYYRMTIGDAVSAGKPSVIIFATPELCTRQICASTLESIDPLLKTYGDRVNFVHVEVYDLTTGKKVPSLYEWGVDDTKWPWVFLVDQGGIIIARYDGLLGVDEVAPVIESLLNSQEVSTTIR